MIFFESAEKINESDIAKLEADLGLTLPKQMIEHYLNYNGGYPESDIFLWPNGEKTTINTFASIKYDGFQSIEENYKNLVLIESYLPVGILPFATDDGGNLFCVSCREIDYGSIYYCNNDHYNTERKEEFLIKIDSSFKHFIENLSSY
jgi:cell wall assembly regulator SMI1